MSNVRHRERRPIKMSFIQRFKYAVCLLIVVTFMLGLALSISEGLGLHHSRSITDLMFQPLYILFGLAIGFVLAPALVAHLPLSGDLRSEQSSEKLPFGFNVRVAALAFLALVLIIVANLAIFLLGKFT